MPLGLPELGFHWTESLRPAPVHAIEVPPTCAVGREVQHTVGRPFGLEDGLADASRDEPGCIQDSRRIDLRHPEFATIPWHVRMISR